MARWKSAGILSFFVIGFLLVSGCTNSGTTPATPSQISTLPPTSIATPTPTMSPIPSPTIAIQTTVVPVPSSGIAASPGVRTIASISGQFSQTVSDVTIPSDYWEMWYTADPLVKGGQNMQPATGTVSAVFPVFSIQVIDNATGTIVDTVEPQGGLDVTLWQKSGDPRPWSQKFYQGNKAYDFVIDAHYLNSYAIDIRIPDK